MNGTSRDVDLSPLNTNQPNDHPRFRPQGDRAHYGVSRGSHASGLSLNQTKHPRYRGFFRRERLLHPVTQQDRVFAKPQCRLAQHAWQLLLIVRLCGDGAPPFLYAPRRPSVHPIDAGATRSNLGGWQSCCAGVACPKRDRTAYC